jgi:anti-sigma factor RsiW
MAEKRPLHEEMLERVVAYYDGELGSAEKVEFEAHLATCKDCQYALSLAQKALPVAEDMLAFKPKHTIDEQVARFEELWAKKRKAEAEAEAAARRTPRRRAWLPWGLALGAAVVAVALLLFLSKLPAKVRPDRDVYAPGNDVVDGGTR